MKQGKVYDEQNRILIKYFEFKTADITQKTWNSFTKLKYFLKKNYNK